MPTQKAINKYAQDTEHLKRRLRTLAETPADQLTAGVVQEEHALRSYIRTRRRHVRQWRNQLSGNPG